MFHVGCCGYTVAKFKYHEAFEVVELPQPFYQPPSQRVLASWRQGAPKNFQFVIKAWQLITHDPMSPTYEKLKNPIPDFKRLNYGFFRPTGEVRRAWETTEDEAELLKARIIVFQCPPNFKPTEENLDNLRGFFGRVARKEYIFVFEPRNWAERELVSICGELSLVPVADPFRYGPFQGNINYLRLHGKHGFNYRYTEGDMRELIEKYKDAGEVYVMFNNSNMFQDALSMKALLAAA